jgi:hypothetical protein
MSKLPYLFILTACFAFAQDQRLQFDWGALAAKATEKVDVNLEGPVLQMASKFLTEGKGDEGKAKRLVQGLKGIFVKSFTFDKEGQYTAADVAAIRSQLRAPDWSNIVDVQEKRESTGIFLKMKGDQTEGIVVVAAEPKELTVVQIIGPIDPSMLSELGGKFGIPKMEMGPKPSPKPKPAPPKKDD